MTLLALVGLTFASYPLGLLIGDPWLLPLLNALPAYVTMTRRLRAGDRRGAVIGMLVWALALAVLGTLFLTYWPSPPGAAVLNGPQYRDEMLEWIRTGRGSEGDVRQFLPQHVLHLAAFVALSLVSASAVSIFMGAVLMNYMDFYVASLARAGAPAWAWILFGWQPWAICRVAAFCMLGAVLAEPLLARIRPYAYPGPSSARRYLLWAGAGILADWLLKWALAPAWGRVLQGALPG